MAVADDWDLPDEIVEVRIGGGCWKCEDVFDGILAG